MRILTVCTGNICRSPYAQLRLQAALDGVRPRVFDVSSAGTLGLVGQPVDPGSARVLEARGLSGDGFLAREMNERLLGDIDLVLPLELAHRDAVLRMAPRLLKRTFTLLELARLLEELDAEQPWTDRLEGHGGISAEEVRSRWTAMLSTVAAERGGRAAAAGSDDVADPYRRSDAHFDAMAEAIDAAIERIVAFERAFGA
jgi:protein-tyrosine phosphatase